MVVVVSVGAGANGWYCSPGWPGQLGESDVNILGVAAFH